MRKYVLIAATLTFVFISGCKKNDIEPILAPAAPPVNTPKFQTITYNDTIFDYFERSADQILHVANNGNPNVYQRYFFGTNLMYTDIAQHFDYPMPQNPSATLSAVKLKGIWIEIAVLTPMGATDSITIEIYNADQNKLPEGAPVYTRKFLPSAGGTTKKLSFNDEITLIDPDGFLIAFHTYSSGSDIFVVANNYCVVSGGLNDGYGERRTKVKLSSSAIWADLIDQGPSMPQDPGEDQLMLDCDMYVYPILEISEDVPL